ncbi:hypothetical protein DOM22_18065 [Bdellovibrio sp. ZAP7]|uniref:hypothetical protein n=1 Tax=Bdellovibrio sp. ZAP7 TaxID=2231053 RepID=UPI00115A270B|nr:hypothetical protein [Bdellovibrio sp. ZAP7]QDK46926.1 hypothetical protein DOM22_18065 [Bdellovibrio sp. ZAP7]
MKKVVVLLSLMLSSQSFASVPAAQCKEFASDLIKVSMPKDAKDLPKLVGWKRIKYIYENDEDRVLYVTLLAFQSKSAYVEVEAFVDGVCQLKSINIVRE